MIPTKTTLQWTWKVQLWKDGQDLSWRANLGLVVPVHEPLSKCPIVTPLADSSDGHLMSFIAITAHSPLSVRLYHLVKTYLVARGLVGNLIYSELLDRNRSGCISDQVEAIRRKEHSF